MTFSATFLTNIFLKLRNTFLIIFLYFPTPNTIFLWTFGTLQHYNIQFLLQTQKYTFHFFPLSYTRNNFFFFFFLLCLTIHTHTEPSFLIPPFLNTQTWNMSGYLLSFTLNRTQCYIYKTQGEIT